MKNLMICSGIEVDLCWEYSFKIVDIKLILWPQACFLSRIKNYGDNDELVLRFRLEEAILLRIQVLMYC